MLTLFLPVSYINNAAIKASEYIPFISGVSRFARKSQKIYNISNPATSTAAGVARITDVCGGPVIKYPTLCGLWITSGITMVVTGNPIAFSMFIEFGHKILKELYDQN